MVTLPLSYDGVGRQPSGTRVASAVRRGRRAARLRLEGVGQQPADQLITQRIVALRDERGGWIGH
jgi:hypothetical protein